jgi:predicted Zn-dependent protease
VLSQAEMESAFGNFARARERATTVLNLAPLGVFIDPAATALARSGDVDRAESIASDLGKRYSLDTIVNEVTLPVIRATAQIMRRQPARAIELLRAAEPYELRDFTVPYTRGLAYLSARMGRDAAAEFQKILHNPGVDPISPYYPLAHVGLARAYALQSDKANSRREYQEFFKLWKNADRDIPILRAAESEYARLK